MDLELLDADATCRLIGGSRPINPATLYRGIKAGLYPRPIKVGPGLSRWNKADVVAVLEARIAEAAR
jgi:predicted DNA-binding transcriptional regulator AlpA